MVPDVADWLLDRIDQPARWVIELGFVVYVLSISAVVLLERRRPVATLAWVLSLVFVPVIGLVLYLVFGRRQIRRHRRRRRLAERRRGAATRNLARLDHLPHGLHEPVLGLVRLALRTAAAPLRAAQAVKLLPEGQDAFDAMEQAIERAREQIHAEFYIWRDDETGRRLTSLLATKARAGVAVYVLYDDWGSIGTPREHFASLVAAGGHVAAFGRLRLRLRLRRSRVNFRNHRKILTVDGREGFTGGLNVGNEYSGRGLPRSPWRDLMVRITGDAVLGLDEVFVEDWADATLREADDTAPAPAPKTKPPVLDSDDPGHDDRLVQIIPSGPISSVVSAIAIQIAAAAANATTRCYIATPYFVPTEALDQNLKLAALRGADVRILVPALSSSDNPLVGLAARSYYDEFLLAGCRIFEYQPGMLHAKYIVIDECVAMIGSANMDVRSFHINYEVTAMFYDRDLTTQLAEIFQRDLAQSHEATLASRRQLSTPHRLAEASARLFSPLL
ncbi:MAG: cardiolipin synthase [Myxococcales bacterium FL481]|nr:MAG: cardiolipin synthase [Myxococcales bacterium FL481]